MNSSNDSSAASSSSAGDLRLYVDERIRDYVESLSPESLRELVDDDLDRCFELFVNQSGGHAGAVWLKSTTDDALVIAYNVGGRGAEIEGQIQQPLDSGLVSKAFQEQKTICHKGMFKHRDQSSHVDKKLAQITAHQIACPFQLFGHWCGVLTVIQTLDAGVQQRTEWGFDDDDITQVEIATSVIGRMMENRFLSNLIWKQNSD